ncbi:uncharacterized protein LOC21395413 [Morus notabilis]|uniref:uncharacterized protein LOC21395413 n=1 Tax=Morus notabilis TaxID=981085 RepID=UPI000CECF851|nr:uncharacterized protein LOC21395413 [Morus notabilis]
MPWPIPRWRNLLLLKNSLIPSSSVVTQFASFHSTPIYFQKWKNNFNAGVKGSHQHQASKKQMRFAIRQRRADTKKALNDFLYRSGPSKFSLPEEESGWKIGWNTGKSDNSNKKHKSRNSAGHDDRYHQKINKRKVRRANFGWDFDEHRDTTFEATFGNRRCTWSFNSRGESFFRSSASEFEWTEHSSWKHSRTWGSSSDSESDDETYTLGSSSDRTILGLPPTGPLHLEDVKKAFRLSALKWHPDKHPGPSQAMAEEKFKLCVDAYNSLCKVLSPA